MIDVKELRIGNIILSPFKKIETVTKIGYTKIWTNRGCYFISEIEPIELTEEWFTKFDFIKEEIPEDSQGVHGWSARFNTKENTMPLLQTHKNSNWGSKQGFYSGVGFTYVNVWLKHVHQLQNLYFALTSEELTIKN